MITKEQIFENTVRLVVGEVGGMYANGASDIDIEPLLNQTYDVLNKFAQKLNDEEENPIEEQTQPKGAIVKTLSRKNRHPF